MLKRAPGCLLVCLMAVNVLPAQQAGSSRLLAYGAAAFGNSVSGQFGITTPAIFEVDPGSGINVQLPVTPGLAFQTGGHAAIDVTGRRFFIFSWTPQPGGPRLHTVDLVTGTTLFDVSLPSGLVSMQYESSTNRLLAVVFDWAFSINRLVEVDPLTGAITPILNIPPGVGPLPGVAAASSAIDPAGNRYFQLYGNQPHLLVIDTVAGSVLSLAALTPGGLTFFDPEFDTASNQLYGLAGSSTWGGTALATVDVSTSVVTPVSSGMGAVFPGALTQGASALDASRGLYHAIVTLGWSNPEERIITLDTASGNVVADPLFALSSYLDFEVDPLGPPILGRVTPAPDNEIQPGSTTTLTFEALGHAGDWYLPFVSCSPGLFPVPGGGPTIPLGFDACTSFYLSSPASGTFFNLTPSGAAADLLPPGAAATGSITLPGSVPPGIAFELYVTFLTLNPALQWGGMHGLTILHVRS